MLQVLFAAITKKLKKKGKISLTGLGTFMKAKRKKGKSRNPSTGEAIKVKAASSLRF